MRYYKKAVLQRYNPTTNRSVSCTSARTAPRGTPRSTHRTVSCTSARTASRGTPRWTRSCTQTVGVSDAWRRGTAGRRVRCGGGGGWEASSKTVSGGRKMGARPAPTHALSGPQTCPSTVMSKTTRALGTQQHNQLCTIDVGLMLAATIVLHTR